MARNELAFMGKMSARMTHDMRNILSILKESSGLMTDVISMNKDADFPHRDKLERSLSRIQSQIPRGMELITEFNWLAHSMDEPKTQIDMNDFLSHIAFLAKSFVRLKSVELKMLPLKKTASFSTDLFRLHWILFSCIDYVLGKTSEGTVIILRAERTRGSLQLQVLYDVDDENKIALSQLDGAVPTELTYLEEPMRELGIRLSTCVSPGAKGLVAEVQA
jgi:signal transduction histidine kinase